MPPTQKKNDHWGFPSTPSGVVSFVNGYREQQIEQTCRERLANGVPSSALACQMHQNILDAKSRARSGRRALPDPELSLVNDPLLAHDPFSAPPPSRINTRTALLPHCMLCFYKHQNIPPGGVIPEAYDSCRCATSILVSNCAWCAFAVLLQKRSSAIAARTREDGDGRAFLICECGSQIMMPEDKGELVRKCAGCGGVMTAPFRNWKGEEVVFEKKREVPAVALPPLEPQEASLRGDEDEVLEPEDQMLLSSARNFEPRPLRTRSRHVEATISPAIIMKRSASSTVAAGAESRANQELTCNHETGTHPPSASQARHTNQGHARVDSASTSQPQPLRSRLDARSTASRRTQLEDFGRRVDRLTLPAIARVMRNFSFTDAETKTVVEFVRGHGLSELYGRALVPGIEKALGRRVE